MKQLSDKQLRFIELYNGNATEAAKLAGYAHAEVQGKRLLQNVKICSVIQERRAKEIKPHIKDRQARQKFWSDFMDNEEKDDKDRMKASELLGKSEGDFLDRVEHSGEIAITKIKIKRINPEDE